MNNKEWKSVDRASIDDLIKSKVIFISGEDPLIIRSNVTMENVFIGCGIAPHKEALNINNEIVQPGSDAMIFLYFRPEHKPKQNEGPINVDANLIGGGSVSPMFKPESHWPDAYWYPGMQQISGVSFSDVFK